MRKFLIPVAIIGLMAGTTFAAAQDHDRGGPRGGEQRGGEQHGGPGGGGQRGGEQRGGPAISGPREHRDAQSPQPQAQNPAAPQPTRSFDNQSNARRPDSGRPDNNNRSDFRGRPDMRDRDRGRPAFDNRGRPNFNNGSRGPRHDFSNFRNYHQNFRAPRRFRAPAYRRPPGWYSHRWGWGEILPLAFWPRNYWITDFSLYDLPPPPFGAVWVRVGEDALLVDRDSGEIIEVDYGVFY